MNDLANLWSQRAKQYGRRCVIDLSVPQEQFESVTQWQAGILLPLLRENLNGTPASILDFGCGCGRFTEDLLRSTNARTYVGYDLCPELVELAQEELSDSRVTFLSGSTRDFFDANTTCFDVVWINSVLGGIPDAELGTLASSLVRALAPQGLLFFSEATSPDTPGNAFWRFRPEADYVQVFGDHGVTVWKVGSCPDMAGRHDVSIFAGKRR